MLFWAFYHFFHVIFTFVVLFSLLSYYFHFFPYYFHFFRIIFTFYRIIFTFSRIILTFVVLFSLLSYYSHFSRIIFTFILTIPIVLDLGRSEAKPERKSCDEWIVKLKRLNLLYLYLCANIKKIFLCLRCVIVKCADELPCDTNFLIFCISS